MAFKAGYTPAAKYSVKLSVHAGKPIEMWAEPWLLGFLDGKAVPVKKGRQLQDCKPEQFLWYFGTCLMVDFWENKVRYVSLSDKVNFISGTAAYELVRAMRIPGQFVDDARNHV